MKIAASVGNAARNCTLDNSVYSLKMTAQTLGERQQLASLLKAIPTMPEAVLREYPRKLQIIEKS